MFASPTNRLLAQVGIQKSIHVVDVTTGIPHKKAAAGDDNASQVSVGVYYIMYTTVF